MAYAFTDSITDPTASVASGTSIGATTMPLTGDYADLPSGGTSDFFVLIGDSAAQYELAKCTRTTDTLTFASALTIAHTAGESVNGPQVAAEFLNWVVAQLALMALASDLTTHAADSTSIHGITDTAQLALKNAANTFTANQRVGSGTTQGTTAAPAVTVGGTTSGLAVPSANNLTLSANATEVARLLSTEFRVQKRMRLNGPLGFDSETVDLTGGGDYTRTSATLIMASVYVDTAGCTFYLDGPATSDFQVIRNQSGSTENLAVSNGDTLVPGAGNLYIYDAIEGVWSSF